MSGGGMGGQSYGGGQSGGGYGGMGGYGQQRSRFGSNPMQTRPWMQPGYGQSQTGASVDSGFHPMTKQMPSGPQGFPGANGSPGNDGEMDSGLHPLRAFGQPPLPQGPSDQPRTGGNDYFQESGNHPMPWMQKPMQYQPQMSAPYSQQAQPKSQPFIPNPSVDRNSLINPNAMMDPALAAKPPPPMPTGQMQPGQTDWQWNAGFANGSPGSGWQAGYDPSHQAYISGNLPGFNQQQLSQVNYNDLLNSIGQISGNPYNAAIYGRR